MSTRTTLPLSARATTSSCSLPSTAGTVNFAVKFAAGGWCGFGGMNVSTASIDAPVSVTVTELMMTGS